MALRVLASRAAASVLRLSSHPRPLCPPGSSFLRRFCAQFPEELKYSKSHEWMKVDGEHGTMGITSFALEQLGDIVYVELPEVGRKVEQGESFCVVESVKAASSVYSPVGGEVIEVNSQLAESPEKLKEDPHGGSWLVKLKLDDQSQLDLLVNAAGYKEIVEGAKH
eukprot:c19149_g3_i2 orf=62-559(+)